MNAIHFPSSLALNELRVLEEEFETRAVPTAYGVVFETALYPTEKLPPYSVHRFDFGPIVKQRTRRVRAQREAAPAA